MGRDHYYLMHVSVLKQVCAMCLCSIIFIFSMRCIHVSRLKVVAKTPSGSRGSNSHSSSSGTTSQGQPQGQPQQIQTATAIIPVRYVLCEFRSFIVVGFLQGILIYIYIYYYSCASTGSFVRTDIDEDDAKRNGQHIGSPVLPDSPHFRLV